MEKEELKTELNSIVKSFVKVVEKKQYKRLDGIINDLKKLMIKVRTFKLPPLEGFIHRNPSKPNTGEQRLFTNARVPLKKDTQEAKQSLKSGVIENRQITSVQRDNKAFGQEAITKRQESFKAGKKVGYNSKTGSGNPALNKIFNTGVNNPATRKTAQKSKKQSKKTIVAGNTKPQLKLTGDKRSVLSTTRSAGYPGNASVTLRTKKQQEVHKHALNSPYVKKLKNDYNTSNLHSHARKLLEAELTKILIESLKTAKSNNATPEEKVKVKETIEKLKPTGLVNVSSLTVREKRKLHGKKVNNLNVEEI